MLIVGLSVALLASLFYTFKLRSRLRSYERVWEEIERIADHNEDGTFTIHVQHLEEHNPSKVLEAHDPASKPSLNVLDLDGWQDGTPPRAA